MTMPSDSSSAPPRTGESSRPGLGLLRRALLILPALAAAALGVVLVYGAGLAQMDALHSAAHDARHSAGFPCH
jgi:cobalt transporter subunit CbtB